MSAATTPPSPSTWMASPPSGAPSSRARLWLSAPRPFAVASSSRGTTAGMRAAVAGAAQPREAGLRRGHEIHDPQLVRAADGEQRQEEDRLQDARHDEDPAAVPAVDEHAADLADDEGRDELGDEDRRRRERRARELEHEHGQADEERPVAEVAHQPAGPQQREAAAAERGAAAGRRRRGHGSGCRNAVSETWTGCASGGASSRVSAMYGRRIASTAAPRAASSSAVTRRPNVWPIDASCHGASRDLEGVDRDVRDPRLLVDARVLQPQVRGARDGIGIRLVVEAEAPARGHRPPRPLPGVTAVAVDALHEPEPGQLAQVVAAVRRRLADDGGALARGLRPDRHEVAEDAVADRVGERAERVDVGDASPVRGGHLAAPGNREGSTS